MASSLSPIDIRSVVEKVFPLTAAGTSFRVDIIALAGHCHYATTMMMQKASVAGKQLRLNGIARVALAQRYARLGMTAVGVARLNHKVLDDTVEEQRVVEMLADEA